jgi:hypothetical protein
MYIYRHYFVIIWLIYQYIHVQYTCIYVQILTYFHSYFLCNFNNNCIPQEMDLGKGGKRVKGKIMIYILYMYIKCIKQAYVININFVDCRGIETC